MLLYYIRHGDPIYDPDSLTPRGHRQAEALARRLAVYGLDEIYASTSNRAMQTAQPTCELLNMKMTTMDWCNERYAWDELTWVDSSGRREWLWTQSELAEALASQEMRDLGRRWYEHPVFAGGKHGKGIRRIQDAADEWLAGLGFRHDLSKNMYLCTGEKVRRVALFAHQGFGLAFLSCVLDVPYPQLCTHFDIGHTGMTVINFPGEEGKWCVPRTLQLSNDSHLYRDGLPTWYHNYIRI